MAGWVKPSVYARANGVGRRRVWTLVEKGALEVRRVKAPTARKRAAGVMVRERANARKS